MEVKEYFKTVSIEINGENYEAYFNAFTPITYIKSNISRRNETDVVEIGVIIANFLFAGFSDNIKEKTFYELAKGNNLELVPLVDGILAWCIEYLQELNKTKKK